MSCLRKGLQTSSCPGIFCLNAAWNCLRVLNESSCCALAWDPHQYPTYAGGQVLRENSLLNIVSKFVGAQGAVSCVDIHFTVHPVSSPSVLFLAFLRSGPSAVCCGSHLHTCHEETAVARHNIISAAEREGKACIAVTRSVYPLQEFKFRSSVQ